MAEATHIELQISTDYLIGPDSERLLTSVIRFANRTATIAEIIKAKLSQEIHAYNERRATLYGAEYLSPAEYDETTAEGEQFHGAALQKGKANPGRELRLAMLAFSEGRFKVLVDGEEIRTPHKRVTLCSDTCIRFVRTVPYRE